LVIRSQSASLLFVLDPSVVLEGVFEKLLELSRVFHYLGLGAGVVDGKSDFEAGFSRTLPQVLPILLCLCVVKLTKAAKTEELLTRRRLVFRVDGRKEALNFGALVANDEASEAVLHYVLVGHVQFVDDLSAMWSELLG